MWRLNSCWRYRQTAAGVAVECESVSLRRSIRRAIRWMATPVINRKARQVMTRTLTSMVSAMNGGFAGAGSGNPGTGSEKDGQLGQSRRTGT